MKTFEVQKFSPSKISGYTVIPGVITDAFEFHSVMWMCSQPHAQLWSEIKKYL